MRYEVLYNPSFSTAKILLEQGHSIRAESGAMVSMSPTIKIDSGITGGFGKALGRLLTGESLFQTTFTAADGAGEVLLAPSTIGDILPVELQSSGVFLTSGCFLACDKSLEVETKASARGFFAGEGLFMMRISGTGTLLASTFGAIHAVNLAMGQPYIVDTGHIVAFTDTMTYNVQRSARSLVGSFTSGEGLVAHFSGPGIVYIQTRSPQSFGGYLSKFVAPGK